MRIFLALLIVSLSACSMQKSPKVQLNVFAAASLKNAFEQIGHDFEAKNPAVQVVYNFAGSQQLAQQIIAGAPADVFASASLKDMQTILDAKYSQSDWVNVFASNYLVVVVPINNPGKVDDFADLSRPGLRLILAAPEVPAGRYAQEALQKARATGRFGTEFPILVQANVVSYEENVRAVLTKVILGEADAGIVYTSDAKSSLEVIPIPIPDEVNIVAQYQISPVSSAARPDLARAFIRYVLSDNGQDALRETGFGSRVLEK